MNIDNLRSLLEYLAKNKIPAELFYSKLAHCEMLLLYGPTRNLSPNTIFSEIVSVNEDYFVVAVPGDLEKRRILLISNINEINLKKSSLQVQQ